MIKIKKPFIVFDLETTGLDVNKDQIIQLAARKFIPCTQGIKHKKDLNLLIRPTVPIAFEASKVHGFTAEKLKKEKTFDHYADKIYKFFRKCDLVGYNIKNFDIPLLFNQLEQHKYKLKLPRIIDVYQVFKEQIPHTLQGAVNYYTRYKEKPFQYKAHNALGDVEATCVVFWEQLLSFPYKKRTFSSIAKQFNGIDLQNKLSYDNGKIMLTFGKYKNVPLEEVPEDYLKFLWDKDVLWKDAKQIILYYLFGEQ